MSERQLPRRAGPPPIALMQCPIAGFQYHGGEACWRRIRTEDSLVLQREPGNRHDPRAIRVHWKDVMLGYVPREANYALSQIMDRGAGVEARVASLRDGADPWQRVMMEVTLRATVAPAAERLNEFTEVMLCPPGKPTTPRLQLAREAGALTAAQREVGVALLRDCLPEIARRLVRPAVGFVHDEIREAYVWDAVAFEIGANGHGLVAHYAEGLAAGGPSVTLDLKRPLGADGWIACFVPAIAAACARHGLTAASMGEPLRRWIGASLQLTFEGQVDFEPLRKAVLEFLAPDPLARSLANRIFGAAPPVEAFNWVCTHASALALCGVEQPAMLPFLRLVQDDKAMNAASDPLTALRERLIAEGLEPAAWKRIPRWGFNAFERPGQAWWKPIPFARYANLLFDLDVQASPPPDFALYALHVAYYRAGPHEHLDFERHPTWFMRALLRELETPGDAAVSGALGTELDGCLDWVIEERPEPDANQQRAGWAWIMEQARAHRQARSLALAAPWRVPVAGMLWGDYRVVAIDSAAALATEANAMKNCLATYEAACRSGEVVVYSIRERSTGKRIACFAAERLEASWQLIDVAGKMNANVDDDLERIGHAMVTKLNGGRGGEVAPF